MPTSTPHLFSRWPARAALAATALLAAHAPAQAQQWRASA